MKYEYMPEELLPLSGIQHFLFCRRQWALIHVERQWQENVLTTEGKLLHDRADKPFLSDVREGIITTRSMPIASYRLGLFGVCDVVEFIPSPEGIRLPNREGEYMPAPIEYKRGHEKKDQSDQAQLCAQAMCLEEMLSVTMPYGYLYYHEIRHRVEIKLTNELRDLVLKISKEMHSHFERGHTPRVKPSRACKSCSLQNVCLPVLLADGISASKYIRTHLDGE
jgi:CRISPR-associated exonuclease Cas4